MLHLVALRSKDRPIAATERRRLPVSPRGFDGGRGLSRRRFTTEELAELASRSELERDTKRSLFAELGAYIHGFILLVLCFFKRTANGCEACEACKQRRPQFVSVKEFARLTTLSTKTIYRDVRVGKLKSVRQGRRVLIAIEELDRYATMRTRDTPHLPPTDSKID